MGNFVLGLPWIVEVAKLYRDSIVVVDPAFADLLEATLPNTTNTIFYPRGEVSKGRRLLARFRAYLKFLRVLRKHRSRVLIDLEGERFTGILSLLSGCSIRIGPREKHSTYFYTSSHVLHYEQHRFNAFGEILSKWQHINTPSNQLEYTIEPLVQKSIDRKLQWNSKNLELAIIHTGASAEFKKWSTAKFAKLCILLSSAGYQVAWIGSGDADLHRIHEIESFSRGIETLNFCNQLSHPELVYLLQKSTLFIGSDSGPMHLASSTGIPVIGLFGPSNEKIWKPLGSNSIVLRGKSSCKIDCEALECKNSHHCLECLDPQVVLNVVLSMRAASTELVKQR